MWVSLMLAGAMLSLSPAADAASNDNQGSEFWLAFMSNVKLAPELTLFITSDTDTSGSVRVANPYFFETFEVVAHEVTTVVLPAATRLVDGQSNNGVHVVANDDVTVYGLNRVPHSTDAFLALPVDVLGTSHLVMSYHGTSTAELAIVGTEDSTAVTLTPPGEAPIDLVLDEGEAYQYSSLDEITGAEVVSDKPVAVFGGNKCTVVPAGKSFCDHLVEQVPPTSSWGTQFVTLPLATRLNGDRFRVLAAEDGTDVSVNGAVVATLGRGEFHEQVIDGASTIITTGPALVAQFSHSSTYDGVTSDPFMILVPPREQFLPSYTLSTPASGFAINYVNVVAPDEAVGDITLDGSTIPAGEFTSIGDGFSGAQVPVDLGSHRLDGPLPFGVFSYGFDEYDSYGYTGGASYSPVATVSTIAVTPEVETLPVGSTGCVTATVSDGNDGPVAGVRIDFEVTGANEGSGFGSTDADGRVDHCWTGDAAGGDTVVAELGNLSASATKTWVDDTGGDGGGDAGGDCNEDGLNSLDLGGLASETVHTSVEPILVGLDDALNLDTEGLVHQVNCGLVVPTEDVVDVTLLQVLGLLG